MVPQQNAQEGTTKQNTDIREKHKRQLNYYITIGQSLFG